MCAGSRIPSCRKGIAAHGDKCTGLHLHPGHKYNRQLLALTEHISKVSEQPCCWDLICAYNTTSAAQRYCSTYLIQTKPLRGWLPASCHQDVVNAIQSDLLILVVFGCHGQLSIFLLHYLDRGEVRLQLNALPLKFALRVFCCLWVKPCTTYSFVQQFYLCLRIA